MVIGVIQSPIELVLPGRVEPQPRQPQEPQSSASGTQVVSLTHLGLIQPPPFRHNLFPRNFLGCRTASIICLRSDPNLVRVLCGHGDLESSNS